MINAFPIIGWVISLVLCGSLAVPFYFIWNRLASTYFYFLPSVYLHLPFWHIVGLFMIIPILKSVLFPSLVSVTLSSK